MDFPNYDFIFYLQLELILHKNFTKNSYYIRYISQNIIFTLLDLILLKATQFLKIQSSYWSSLMQNKIYWALNLPKIFIVIHNFPRSHSEHITPACRWKFVGLWPVRLHGEMNYAFNRIKACYSRIKQNGNWNLLTFYTELICY